MFAEHILTNLQGLIVQRFGFSVVAHLLKKARQIVEAYCYIRVPAAKHFSANLESLFV